MKKMVSIVIFTFIITFSLFAQPPRPRILGVIMGISKYQNVPSLKYADRDAMSFYNFLLSPAGGGADTNNIRLLLNEKATSYNFFEAMDNLLDMAKEGDQVYIYFAGHGDIEKKTERQNGFLIGYNAPQNCYASGGCVPVRFLQDYVETLVSKNKSKVTMIIDACRSGKLAGGSQGAEITALALQAEWKGVTKILSCQPGETSLEGDQWGGGGGVFTYFMLKGMLGQADKNLDGIISVMELNNFLDENVLKETNEKQLPVVIGDRRQEIVKVDKKHALAMLNQMEKPISLPPEKESAGFEADKSSIDDIKVLKEYEKFKYYINNNNLLAYNDSDKNKETALSIYRSLESSRNAQSIISKMKGELLAALQNRAQISINDWLNSENNTKSGDSTFLDLKAAFEMIDSTHPQYSQIKFRLVFWSQYYTEDIIKKILILEDAIKISPDQPIAYLNLGYYYSQQKNSKEALKCYEKAIDLSNNWAWAYNGKGCILNELRQFGEAIKSFDEAIRIKPAYNSVWFNKGNSLEQLKKYDEAIACYDEAIRLNLDTSIIWFHKGKMYQELGRKKDALNSYDRALKLNPRDSSSWTNKGQILMENGNVAEAISCFDEALKINPDFIEAFTSKLHSLILLGKRNEALELKNKLAELKPVTSIQYYSVGLSYSYLDQLEDANINYDKAIELDSNYAEAWCNKGLDLKMLKRFNESLYCYEKAVNIKPNLIQGWYNMGVLFCESGKYDETIKCNDKVLQINPKYYLAWAYKGYANVRLKKYEEAIKCYDMVLGINPNDVYSIYNIACIYSTLQTKPEMLKYLKKAIELDKKYKIDAPKDEDFKEYWNDPDFLELVK